VFAPEVFAMVLVREAVKRTLGMLHSVVEASPRSVMQVIEPVIFISLENIFGFSEPGISIFGLSEPTI
jgi:hypothetical protein